MRFRRVKANDRFCEAFGVEVGVHRGSKCPDYTAPHHCVRGAHSIQKSPGPEVIKLLMPQL